MDYDKVEAAVASALRERGHTVPQNNFLRFTAQQVYNLVRTASHIHTGAKYRKYWILCSTS